MWKNSINEKTWGKSMMSFKLQILAIKLLKIILVNLKEVILVEMCFVNGETDVYVCLGSIPVNEAGGQLLSWCVLRSLPHHNTGATLLCPLCLTDEELSRVWPWSDELSKQLTKDLFVVAEYQLDLLPLWTTFFP